MNPINATGVSLSRRSLLQAAALALPCAGALAQSAAWAPTGPVKLVLPQPPGGAADRLGRALGEALQQRWKQPVVLDNKPGGGVVVGTLATVRSAPNGYTLGLLGSSLSINAVQRKDLPYDALKDLMPLARVGHYTVALLAAASFPASDIKGLVALAKGQPNKYSFGSNGIGTSAHLAGEMLNHMAGIELQHVPYNGAAKMYTDMIGGQVPLGFAILSSAEAFIRQGQLKVLGITTAQRSSLFPAYPTIAETLPGFEAVNWAGILAPAGVPRDVAKRISDDILAVLQTPEITKALSDMGIDPAPQGPADFEAFIRDEITRFARATKPLGTRMQ